MATTVDDMDRERRHPIAPPWTDVLLAAVLVVMGGLLAVGNSRILTDVVDSYEPPTNVAIVSSIVVAVAPVALRRVYPWAHSSSSPPGC